MCVPIIGEPKAVIAREDDAVDLHERHAPRHMPWILDGHVITRGEGTEHQRFAEHAAVVLDAGQQSPTPAGFGFLGGRQARGVLLEALDAEELGADRLLERFSGDQRDVVNGGARMA